MMFGGMVGQIIILAMILKLILSLVAKHEADTSLPKVAMVVAGITLGNMLIMAMASQFGPIVVVLGQIVFMATMIMTFCWISFGKSVIVVITFVACNFAIAFVQALIFAKIFGSLASPIQPMTAGVPEQNQGDTQSHIEPVRMPSPEAMQAEATRLKAKSDAKRAEVEARIREMEEGDSMPVQSPSVPIQTVTTPAPKPAPVPAPVPVPVPAPIKPVAAPITPAAVKINSKPEPASEWEMARRTLKIGGIMSKKDKFTAMVNGEMVEEGDVVSATIKGSRYRWKIGPITSKEVPLNQLDVSPSL